ncbi:MAG: 2-oxoacid:acceptor oxidoreductase subunit alpha, partial [Akkermansiaceae bacterium]
SLLIVGWGSTYGPIKEATDRMISEGHKVGAVHLRHVHPLPNDITEIFEKYDHVLVPEMNDSGMYGRGQLATLLRAKTCNPKIHAVNQVQGLSFRVLDIVTAAEQLIANK